MDIIFGQIVKGHGVASGRAGDPRFPEGTLALQWPIFEKNGLNLNGYYRATINISVFPLKPNPINPTHTFKNVKWHADCPAEDFSFFEVSLSVGLSKCVTGLIYWPHPETKPEHFQDPSVIEVTAPKIDEVSSNDSVRLWVDPRTIFFD